MEEWGLVVVVELRFFFNLFITRKAVFVTAYFSLLTSYLLDDGEAASLTYYLSVTQSFDLGMVSFYVGIVGSVNSVMGYRSLSSIRLYFLLTSTISECHLISVSSSFRSWRVVSMIFYLLFVIF